MGPRRVELRSSPIPDIKPVRDPQINFDVLPIDYRPVYKIKIVSHLNLLLFNNNKDKMFERTEEETFSRKPMRSIDLDDRTNMKINILIKKLDVMFEKISLLENTLDYISGKVDKALNELVVYDSSLEEIEARVNLIRSKIDDMDASAPSVEIENVSGRDQAF